MSDELVVALAGPFPPVMHLLTLHLPDDRVVRLTDGGFVVWGDEVWTARDSLFGTVGALPEIEDGVTGGAARWDVTLLPEDAEAIAILSAPAAQGSLVTLHLASVTRATGLMAGEPDLLMRARLDIARLAVGANDRSVILECQTEAEMQLAPRNEQRLTDGFLKQAFPGARGLEYLTELGRPIYWRKDAPRDAIK